MERYRMAYRVAETAMSFAETVKLVGIFVAGVLVVSALMVFQTSPEERIGFPVVSAALIAGAILVVLASYLWRMIFRVQGHLLQVATDSAVNSSPLLSNTERARVMSAGNDAATLEIVRKRAA